MPKSKDDQFERWVSSAFKGLVVCIFSMFTFFVSQLNGSIASLTSQLKAMEQHQVETDKRVAAIEVSREMNMDTYKKLIGDVQDIKSQTLQNTLRLETITTLRRLK